MSSAHASNEENIMSQNHEQRNNYLFNLVMNVEVIYASKAFLIDRIFDDTFDEKLKDVAERLVDKTLNQYSVSDISYIKSRVTDDISADIDDFKHLILSQTGSNGTDPRDYILDPVWDVLLNDEILTEGHMPSLEKTLSSNDLGMWILAYQGNVSAIVEEIDRLKDIMTSVDPSLEEKRAALEAKKKRAEEDKQQALQALKQEEMLEKAVKSDDIKAIKSLVEENEINLSRESSQLKRPLILTALDYSPAAVEYIIATGISPLDGAGSEIPTALEYVYDSKNDDLFYKFIELSELSIWNEANVLAGLLKKSLAEKRHQEFYSVFDKFGEPLIANMQALGDELMMIAYSIKDLTIIEYLIKNGAKVNGVDVDRMVKDGMETSVDNFTVNLVALATKQGFNINHQHSFFGGTTLSRLIVNNKKEKFSNNELKIVNILAEAGNYAVIGREDENCSAIIKYAKLADMSYLESFKKFNIEFLGTSTGFVDGCLYKAVKLDDPKLVSYLLEIGADMYKKDVSHAGYIFSAAMLGNHYKSAEALLSSGFDINKKDGESDSDTTLHFMAGFGSEESINYLLDAGADPNIKGKDGKTAFECYLNRFGSIDVDIVNSFIKSGTSLDEALRVSTEKNNSTVIQYLSENYKLSILNSPSNHAENTPVIENSSPKKTVNINNEEIDPVSEAEIYLAYSRYSTAADILTGAIDAGDTRIEVVMMLLSVYSDAMEQDKFLAVFEQFKEIIEGNTEEYNAAIEMKESLSSAMDNK